MDQIKEKFLIDPNTIFLNHGSYGACPRPVFEEYQKWQGIINSHAVDEENVKSGDVNITVECKNIVGAILNTKSGRFTSDSSFKEFNSTDASMEFVASMVDFNPRFGAED